MAAHQAQAYTQFINYACTCVIANYYVTGSDSMAMFTCKF